MLSGPQRVAALMIVLGKEAAGKILLRLSHDEVLNVAKAAATLGTVDRPALERVIDDFSAKLAEGPDVIGNLAQAQDLVADRLGPQEAERWIAGPAASSEVDVWKELNRRPIDQLSSLVSREPPWIVSAIVDRLAPDRASEIIAQLDDEARKAVIAGMLTTGTKTSLATQFLERAIYTEMTKAGGVPGGDDAPRRIADVMNRMRGGVVEDVLSYLSSVAPEGADKVRSRVFRFEEICLLSQADRAVVFDELATEKVILALKGAAPDVIEAVLSSLGARARRMVEAELATDARAPERETEAARRAVVETVLRLVETGAIERPGSPSHS